MSDRVDAMTFAVKVEALNSWSALSIYRTFISLASASDGTLPVTM